MKKPRRTSLVPYVTEVLEKNGHLCSIFVSNELFADTELLECFRSLNVVDSMTSLQSCGLIDVLSRCSTGVRQQMVSSPRDRSRQCRFTGSDSVINRPKLPNFINSHATENLYIEYLLHKSKHIKIKIMHMC